MPAGSPMYAAVERDGDAVEALGHEGARSQIVRLPIWRICVSPAARERDARAMPLIAASAQIAQVGGPTATGS